MKSFYHREREWWPISQRRRWSADSDLRRPPRCLCRAGFHVRRAPLTPSCAAFNPERMTLLADATDFFGTDALQDPYPLYDRMRDQASVHRIGDSVFYAVCGWDAVMEAVNRVEDFSSNLTATMVYHDDGTVTPFDMGPLGGPQHALATADDPVHDAHRKVLLPHLSARRVRVIEEFAEATAIQLWSEGVGRRSDRVDERGGQSAPDDGGRPPARATRRRCRQADPTGLRHHDPARRRRYPGPSRSRWHGCDGAIWVRHGALREGR